MRVSFPEGVAEFDLGPQAERWAQRILRPPGLLDKLGVKPEAKVSVLGIAEQAFRRQLRERARDVSFGRARPGSDPVFVGMSKKDDLRKLKALRALIKAQGAVWVVWPKGRSAFREGDIRAAGPRAGLVDVKVVSLSESLGAPTSPSTSCSRTRA